MRLRLFGSRLPTVAAMLIGCAWLPGCADSDDHERLNYGMYEPGDISKGRLVVPQAFLPLPGQCRIWYPERRPEAQPSAAPCADVERTVPPGAWLVYRPADNRQYIQVREFPVRPGDPVVIR